jgi:hypothetical protein
LGIRKAIALVRFVDFQETYMTDDRNGDGDDDSDDDDDGNAGAPSAADLTARAEAAERWASRAAAARAALLAEVGAACGDGSVFPGAGNASFGETLEQVATLEAKDASALRARAAASRAEGSALQAAQTLALAAAALRAPPPHDFLCPITHELMRDPALVADGFSYERTAIAQWLRAHSTSPKTNRRLAHKRLVPNLSLKAAIAEYAARIVQSNGPAAASAGGHSDGKRRRPSSVPNPDDDDDLTKRSKRASTIDAAPEGAAAPGWGCVVC